jgi:hypothetical protein
MPSWIRKLIKINGKYIEESDYSALHPNIAMKIYGGNEKYITHNKVADVLNLKLTDVKIEHLSFFNKRWKNMYESPLFYYYNNSDSSLLENMYEDKKIDHTITSKKMFKMEVDIMTEVIKRLNSEGIIVGYVYDALFSEPKYKQRVEEVMNNVVLEFGVYTIAK